MFFQYLGTEPLDVTPPGQHPGHQNTFTIPVSPNGQTTNNDVLYRWLFDEKNPQRELFRHVSGFHLLEEELHRLPGKLYDDLSHTQDMAPAAPMIVTAPAEEPHDQEEHD